MAVSQAFRNPDEVYEKVKRGGIIIVNDVNSLMDSKKGERVNDELYTIYTKSYIESLPSCNCGHFKSKFREGKICPLCNTVCKEEDGSKPVIWIRAYPNMPFINIAFWSMVRYTLDKKFDVLRWLSDTTYNPAKKPDFIHGLLPIVKKRSYQNMIANFTKIIEHMKGVSKFKIVPALLQSLDGILEIWETKRDIIFSQHLPIHNKKLFVMEATNKGRFVNLLVATTVDVVNGWLLTEDKISELKMNTLTAKTISMLSDSDKEIVKDYIAGKKKLLRKHIYGFRVMFSFRCTITAIPRPHQYDVIEIPYSVGVTAFEPIILNMLVNRHGMKFMDAQKYLYKHINVFSPLISEILDTMVEESPYKGIPVLTQRNPTLMPGSMIRTYGVFKKNVSDKTVSISKMIVSIMNGDYDGDQLNFTILLDNFMADRLSIYDAHHNIVGYESPLATSGLMSMQSPADSIIKDWIKAGDVEEENDTFWKDI